MIVTGPAVIAPLLRQAKLSHRPAALLQWEAIVDDPIGALAAVLAYEVIVVSVAASTGGAAAVQLIIGLVVSIAAGVAGGYGIAQALRRGWVPEYMKVSVLFSVLICVFSVQMRSCTKADYWPSPSWAFGLRMQICPLMKSCAVSKNTPWFYWCQVCSCFWSPQLIWG